jgi:tetratricopeptide (TPR) repeat protein
MAQGVQTSRAFMTSTAEISGTPLENAGGRVERRLSGWLVVALLVVMAAAIFHPIRKFDFVNFDDDLYLYTNPWLRQGITAKSLEWAFTAQLTHFSQRAEYWSPITLLTRLFDAEFFGINAGPHHVTSAVLHTLNAVLLFFAMRTLTGASYRSAFVAMLFLVHPQNIEPVGWLSARKDIVSGTFFFLILWAYAWYARQPSRLRYALLLLAFCGGCMAKPMVVSVPLILMLLDFWPLRRWPVRGAGRELVLRLIGEKLPLMILAAIIAALAVLSQKEWGAMQSADRMPLGVRMANALVSYATYFRRVFWPNDLAIFYPHPGSALPMWQAGVALLVLIAITAGALLLARQAGYLIVGWLWFGLSLGPVIGLVQIGNQSMADRYMYQAGVGIFVAVVWGFAEMFERRQRFAIAIGVVAVLALAIGTSWQLATWQNSVTAFSRALAVTKNNDMAMLNLGSAYYVNGDLPRAHEYFLQSLRLRPKQPKGWNNLAAVMNDLGREKEAMEAYRIAVEMDPNGVKSQFYYARLLLKHGQGEEAEMRLRRVIELEPGWAEPYFELGRWLTTKERWDEAGKMLGNFLQLRPQDKVARELMGVVEAKREGGR